MGRPRIGQKHKVAFPEEVLDELHLIAAARGVSVHDAIREAVSVYVKRMRRGGRAA
jgi:hypothetical protein